MVQGNPVAESSDKLKAFPFRSTLTVRSLLQASGQSAVRVPPRPWLITVNHKLKTCDCSQRKYSVVNLSQPTAQADTDGLRASDSDKVGQKRSAYRRVSEDARASGRAQQEPAPLPTAPPGVAYPAHRAPPLERAAMPAAAQACDPWRSACAHVAATGGLLRCALESGADGCWRTCLPFCATFRRTSPHKGCGTGGRGLGGGGSTLASGLTW